MAKKSLKAKSVKKSKIRDSLINVEAPIVMPEKTYSYWLKLFKNKIILFVGALAIVIVLIFVAAKKNNKNFVVANAKTSVDHVVYFTRYVGSALCV